MASMKNDKLTPKQAAESLKVHPVTLRKWIVSGRLPVTREGRAVWINPADLEPFRALSEPRRTCPECKATFAPGHKKAVFCSDPCRDAAKNRKVSLSRQETNRQKAVNAAEGLQRARETIERLTHGAGMAGNRG
jgi:excisionase family DNA binding protein